MSALPWRLRSSWGVPTHTSRPFTTMASLLTVVAASQRQKLRGYTQRLLRQRQRAAGPRLGQSAAASSIRWVVKTMLRPLPDVAAASASHSPRRANGSRPALGSSRSSREGVPTSARATDSFRRVPPDSVRAGWLVRGASGGHREN